MVSSERWLCRPANSLTQRWRWAGSPMAGAVVAPLHHRSEGLHAVDVGLAPDVLADRVPDRGVVRQALVARQIVRVVLSLDAGALRDEPLQLSPTRRLDHPRADAVGGADLARQPPPACLTGPDHRSGARRDADCSACHRSTTRPPPPARYTGPVLLEALPDAVRHVPSAFVRDVQVAVQLHAAGALDARRHDVDGDRHAWYAPWNCRSRRRASRRRTSGRSGSSTASRVGGLLLDVVGAPARAGDAVRQAGLDEPRFRRFVRGEHPHQRLDPHTTERPSPGSLAPSPGSR